MKFANNVNPTTRYSLVRDVAARLGKNPIFEGGEKAVCRLYAKVPFKYVELHGTPMEYSGAFNDCVLDLLICRNDRHEDSLGVIFDFNPDSKLAEPPLDTLLINPGQTPEKITEFIEYRIDKWVYDRFEPDSGFMLRALPAEEVSGETGGALRDHLIRERLLLADGSVSTYGRELGLLEQFGPDDSGKGYRVTQHQADILKEALPPGRKALSGKIPLKTRRNRLENGLPCDEKYAENMAESLLRLLKTPLDLLCGEDPQISAALDDELEYAQILLDRCDRRPVHSYGGALDIVRALYQGYRQSGQDRSEKTEQADIILTHLARLLVNPPAPPREQRAAGPRSLRERLSSLEAKPGVKYPILSVPVAHYYYAAAILDQSNYPNWLCVNRFHIRNENKYQIDMASMLKWYLGEIPGYKTNDILTHLYDLLVEPIFPDLDPGP